MLALLLGCVAFLAASVLQQWEDTRASMYFFLKIKKKRQEEDYICSLNL